jgi:hypothetical protein
MPLAGRFLFANLAAIVAIGKIRSGAVTVK